MNDADRERYLRFVRAVGTGEAITEDDWLFHFEHQNAGARSGVDATLPTYEGTVRITGRFRPRWSPPPSLFAGLEDAVARRAIPPGAYRLPAVLRYQACDDTTCLPPRSVEFDVPIEVEATVERPA